MADLTFKANLLPNTDLGKALGSSNQRWNIYGELNGNASSADKLKTSRNINGTAFNGTANITTANWGTARTLTIGGTGKSVNGSANVSWSKAEILGSSDTTKFYRGDQTWSNVITGGFSATGGNITAGTTGDTSDERSVRAASGAGLCFIYSAAAKDGNRGLWITDSTSGGGTACNLVFANGAGRVFYTDSYNHNSTALAYSQPGLAASNVSWFTCWNGYELRAISKAEMANAVDSSHKWVRLTGDTTSGALYSPCFWANQGSGERQCGVTYSNGNLYFWANPSSGTAGIYDSNSGYVIQRDTSTNKYNIYGQKVYGAVWNDYAEYRKDNLKEEQEPGRCVREVGDGTLALTIKRLERGCEIISDTFGFAIGQNKENGYNTPIASNGRVLAYPYESIEEFSKHIGWPVCSGPDGTVSIMTEDEEEKYPSRIIGTISEIPTYKEWGTGKVKVNGRIWIRIK